MQSIIKSSISKSKILLINSCKPNGILISRSFCNDHNNNNTTTNFEKFRENRNLIKLKSELIKEITQSKILGNSEQVFKLQKQVSDIEKKLDPSIELFSVQSKQQKEKELALWKSFIEKKGITNKLEATKVNKYEFERYKNTGLLDIEVLQMEQAELERIEKLEEQRPKSLDEMDFDEDEDEDDEDIDLDTPIIDPYEAEQDFEDLLDGDNAQFSTTEKLEIDDIIRDPFKSVKGTVSLKKQREIQKYLQEIKLETEKDPQFKLLVENFLDDSIPLKDKLIFKSTTKTDSSKEGDEGEDEEVDEKKHKLDMKKFKLQIRKLQQLTNKDEEILKTNIRNKKIIDFKKNGGSEPTSAVPSIIGSFEEVEVEESPKMTISNNALYALHPDNDEFSGVYDIKVESTLEDSEITPLLYSPPYKVVFSDEIPEGAKIPASNEKNIDSLFKDIEEKAMGESSLFKGEEGEEDDETSSYDLATEGMEEDSPMDLFDDEDPIGFTSEVLLGKNETPEVLDENSSFQSMSFEDVQHDNDEFVYDTPLVSQFKENVIARGKLLNMEKRVQIETDQPELESPLLMQQLKIIMDKENQVADKQHLETHDPKMIRNFIKYKVDQETHAANKQKEENFKQYNEALDKVQQILTKKSMENMNKTTPIYNPNTGKLFVPKKKNPKCLLCQDPNWQVDPINVPFLALYFNEEGDILPRHYTGNCSKHQKKIAKTIRHAKALGIFSYKNGTFTIEDPNVYNLNKQELAEYNKWYNVSYTDEEWNAVAEELGDLEIDEPLEQETKVDQQEQVMLEFGIEVNDVGKMYGKDIK